MSHDDPSPSLSANPLLSSPCPPSSDNLDHDSPLHRQISQSKATGAGRSEVCPDRPGGPVSVSASATVSSDHQNRSEKRQSGAMSTEDERKPLRVDTDTNGYGTDPASGTPKLERGQSWVFSPKDPAPSLIPPSPVDVPKSQMSAQQAFLMKVYAILCVQLAITVGACLVCMYVEPVRYAVVHQSWIFIVALLTTFVWIFLLFWRKNNYPDNILILTGFTLNESWLIGTISGLYYENGTGELILIAWGITLFIFVSLTVFVWASGLDFGWMGMILFPCLLCFCLWGVASLIFGFHLGWVYSLLGALLFSAYIVFDSWMIMNKLGVDDWPIACIELYLDIINLFLHILALLGKR